MNRERHNKIVFVDFAKLKKEREKSLGRKLSKVEEVLGQADTIRTDAIACGRTVAETVRNIGDVPDAVKAELDLIPSVN
jgi:hypothetical protein